MAKQTGTLVGATVRVNDDQDIYPVAIDNEVKGGRQSVQTIAQRDAIPAARRSAGMQCYVFADQNTYKLKNDLVTWVLDQASASGGSTNPGQGGTSNDISLISGNFGEWTDLPAKSGQIVNEDILLQYKSDLQAFPTRAITYIKGQFGLNSLFVGTSLLLGILPENSIPPAKIRKWFTCQNFEIYLVIDIDGSVTLVSKDGANLPTTDGTPETYPYYLEAFFCPDVTLVEPTIYTSTRTASYQKNNCGVGFVGTEVVYSKDYTSTVDQATADALAAADDNFDAEGQANANATGSCNFDPTYNAFVTNNRLAGIQQVIFTAIGGGAGPYTIGGTLPGTTGSALIDGTKTYTVRVVNTTGARLTAQVNGGSTHNINPGNSFTFNGPFAAPITVILTS